MRRVLLLALLLSLAAGAFAACSDDAGSSPETTDAAVDVSGSDVAPGGEGGAIDAAAADAGDSAAGPALRITLTRGAADAGPSPIAVVVSAEGANGMALTPSSVTVTADGNAVSAPTPSVSGSFVATITPAQPSGEIPIVVTATVDGQSLMVTRTALVLPFVSNDWEQPESVDGLVNTPGYEDGVVVSPDGEWLFVDSYSPVDAICCFSGCGAAPNPFSAACQTSLGPHGAPERPGMFGADRIVSPTRIVNRCDKLCFAAPDGGEIEQFALPPVASFGFRRQPDGSFAQPFVIGIDADGCDAPFGLSLLGPPNGTSAEAVLAATDPTSSSTGNDLFYAKLTLGAPNVLARFSCVGGAVQASDVTVARLGIHPLANNQGNPQWNAPYLFFDDDLTANPPTMLVAKATGGLPDASFTASAPLPIGSASDDRRQPFLFGSELYYARNLTIARSHLAGDPTIAGSWSTPTSELVGESGSARVGAVIALGQPTVASRPGGASELYFVYGVKTATGIDMQAGRVRRR